MGSLMIINDIKFRYASSVFAGDYTLVLHKIPAQNRFAASIAASKALYSFFLDLT